MRIIDCRGTACPDPAEAIRTALEDMKFPLEVRLDRPEVLTSAARMLGTSGYRYQTIQDKGETRIIITGKSSGTREEISHPVLLITSFTLGRGSDELGLALMKSFLHTLSQSPNPGTIYFLNSGVKLCAGPDALVEYMKALERKDWHLESCGTCLDYYALKDQVRVGSITNMFAIAQGIQGASTVISL